jgi:hypothetical protein
MCEEDFEFGSLCTPWLWATAIAGSTVGWDIVICALFLGSHLEVYHIPERGLKGFEAKAPA